MTAVPTWIDITASDGDRSRRFYAALFGWHVEVDTTLDYGLISASADEERGKPRPVGGIGQAGGANQHPVGVVAYFPVADLPEALDRARSLGSETVVEPWTVPGLGEMAVITDPDGNRIGLMAAITA